MMRGEGKELKGLLFIVMYVLLIQQQQVQFCYWYHIQYQNVYSMCKGICHMEVRSIVS